MTPGAEYAEEESSGAIDPHQEEPYIRRQNWKIRDIVVPENVF